MKKMTNTQKILKALRSGPKTQAELMRQTGVKNVYQVVSDLKKKNVVFEDSIRGRKCISLRPPPRVVRTPDKVVKATLDQIKVATEKLEPKVVPNEHVDRIAMLKDEIDNINDGIRALMMAKSYLLRRAEEESRRA